MTEIGMNYLSPIVPITDQSSLEDIIEQLRLMPEVARRRSVVVVDRGGGNYDTFRYIDLFEHLAADESIGDLPIPELLGHVDAVRSKTVVRTAIGIGDASDLQADAPGTRLLVLEGGGPVGVLINQVLGGGNEAVRNLEQRVFEAQAAMAEPPADDNVPRWLSARVEVGLEQRRRSFKAGAVNKLTVGIAPADKNLIQSDEEFPHEVPEGEVHTMDVLLWAPDLLDKPLTDTFDVGHTGASVDPATFDINVPADRKQVEIEIQVSYKGRAVQGAKLTGIAYAGPDTSPDIPADAAINLLRTVATGIDLATVRPFDATVVVIDQTVVVSRGNQQYCFALGGIKEAGDVISDELYNSAIAAAHEAEDGKAGKALLALLQLLAYQGSGVYQALMADAPDLATAGTIEVVLRNAGQFFPLEFVYDRGVPGDEITALCPQWKERFQEGKTDCANCPAAADPTMVCPLGFWGLSKEIARRIEPTMTDDELKNLSTSNPSGANPYLGFVGQVVIAASSKVDGEEGAPGQIEATFNEAVKLLGQQQVALVEDWERWVAAVEKSSPSLLLAMSHTEHLDNIHADALQIGPDTVDPGKKLANLRALDVGYQHVRVNEDGAGPIVLLFGCGTSRPDIGYLGFVPAFIHHRAAVVVGTVAKILGRQAAPVARQFLNAAVAAQGTDKRLGEILRQTRGDMLIEGNFMGLTLAAYGNSDWQFAPKV